MGHIRVTDLIEILIGAVAGALICTWVSSDSLPVLARTLLVFLSMKIAGHILRATLVRGETHYFEDILGDLASYFSLALVASAAIWAAGRYLGGAVEPVFPGTIAHAVLTIMPARERRRRTTGG